MTRSRSAVCACAATAAASILSSSLSSAASCLPPAAVSALGAAAVSGLASAFGAPAVSGLVPSPFTVMEIFGAPCASGTVTAVSGASGLAPAAPPVGRSARITCPGVPAAAAVACALVFMIVSAPLHAPALTTLSSTGSPSEITTRVCVSCSLTTGRHGSAPMDQLRIAPDWSALKVRSDASAGSISTSHIRPPPSTRADPATTDPMRRPRSPAS